MLEQEMVVRSRELNDDIHEARLSEYIYVVTP